MPRPERPVDPQGDVLQRWAADLRRLRENAGSPVYRELARRTHYSVTTLSEAAAGRKLPSLAVTLAYVRACGGDPAEWEARWRAVAAELAPIELERPTGDIQPPYVGLATFQLADADRFFGRSRFVSQLLDCLAEQRLVAVFGPSGCGKSSLLRAGLLPAVSTSGESVTVLFTPGVRPLETCAAQMAKLLGIPASTVLADLRVDPHHLHLAIRQVLADRPPEVELLLVVDQFEEVFTLCPDEGERAQFIAALLAAADASTSRVRVVLGVRADFYGRCAEHPDLVEALRGRQLLVGPMTAEELREAIVQPAVRAGLTVENTLVSTIVSEMVRRPGALPLMSHALVETWRRRRGATLSLVGYQTAGGIEQALTQSADRAYRALDEQQQQIAREIFLRLTACDAHAADTRRRADRAELAAIRGEQGQAAVALVLDSMIRARLITTAEDTVEIAHEALIRSWPRLAGWLAEDRDGLRLHQQLTEAARVWESLDRDPGALYRGLRLAIVREWHSGRGNGLTPSEQDFLDTSVNAQTRERSLARRRIRRLRFATLGLALVLVLGATAGVIAIRQGHAAADERNVAQSRELAARATALGATRPEEAMLLAVQAFQQAPTAEARSALLSAQAQPFQTRLTDESRRWESVRYSPDGQLLAAGSMGGAVSLWDVRSHTGTALTNAGGTVRALAFSRDGHTLATGASNDSGRVVLWDVSSRTPRAILNTGSPVMAVSFSPDGHTLAAAGAAITLWDAASGSKIASLTDSAYGVWGAAFDHDGRTLLTGDYNGTLTMWDVATHQRRTAWKGHRGAILQITFSPNGTTFATAAIDGTVKLWDAAKGTELVMLTNQSSVMGVAFSPDGQTLAAVGEKISLWNVPTHRAWATWNGHRDVISDVAFNPDGHTLATASEDHTIAIWDTTHGVLATQPVTPARAARFSPDGTTVLTAAWDGTAEQRDTATGKPLATWKPDSDKLGQVVTFDPTGQSLALVNYDGQLKLWTRAKGWSNTTVDANAGVMFAATFSPDGQTVATLSQRSGTADMNLTLWQASDSHQITTWLVSPRRSANNPAIAYSSDGHDIITTDGTQAQLWDVASQQPKAMADNMFGNILAVSRNGHVFVTTGDDGTISLRDASAGTTTTTLPSQASGVRSAAFSPDGTVLATGYGNGTIRIWDITARTEMAALTGHTGTVGTLTFSPDGHSLASTGDDGTTRLWNLDTALVTQRLCTTLRDTHHQPDCS